MPNFSGIWSSSQQFQARGQNIWPRLPGAPTIGTATAGNNLCASVTFTAPTCAGFPASISSYTVTSTPGCITASGAASPITVSGLTNATSYTFKVKATNSTGAGPCSATSNSITASLAGSQSYTTAGTYTWIAPSGVTSVSVVAVGGGGGGGYNGGGSGSGNAGAGGGGLGYRNNIAVTPGNGYTVVVGAGGAPATSCASPTGGTSYFCSTSLVRGNGGASPVGPTGGSGGGYVGTGGGNGGNGGAGTCGGGGGGAGGYSGNGGNGGGPSARNSGAAGAGGGGGGGSSGGVPSPYPGGGGGGGVGILGQGANGAGGVSSGSSSGGGGGGSGGANGTNSTSCFGSGAGGIYGGGSGGAWASGSGTAAAGARGAVRIVWPGTTRQFPSTCVGAP